MSAAASIPAPRRSPGAGSFRYRRTWVVAFLGFFLLGAGWALGTPYDGSPDEGDHILRAYGVATGQVLLEPANAALGGGAFVDAPRSLVVDRCWQFKLFQDVSCSGSPGEDQTVESVPTSVGRNSPVYYAFVGVPIAISPDWTGVLLGRLIAVLLSGLLLATALADAMRWSRHRLLPAAVIAGTTPIVLHLAGSINPNALEITAATAFFAAAVPLLLNPQARRDNTLLWHAGVAALVLATTRMLGPLWLGLAVAVLLLPWRRAKLADLWAWRRLRYWLIAVMAACGAGAGWALLAGSAESNPYYLIYGRLSPFRIVRMELQNWGRYLDEMVGVNSWLDARMPEIGYIIWPIVGGALVLWGFVMAGRADRLRLVGLIAAAIGVPMAISIALANTFGFITQGRYLLPLLVGVVMLATFILDQALPADHARTVLWLVTVALLPIHLLALFFAMRRWQLGVGPGWNLYHGTWQPVVGPVVPLLTAIAGAAVLGALLLFADFRSGISLLRLRGRGEGTSTPTDDVDPSKSPTPAIT